MPGLIDTDEGLSFGDGLQFQTPIGGGGLDISTDSVPGGAINWGAAVSDYLAWGAGSDDEITWGS